MKTIVVADDDPKVHEILQWYLEETYRVVNTLQGAGIGALVRQEQADLLLLDVMLPGADGLQVLQQVHQASRLPVILLTARSQEHQIINGLSLGADDYITKPFSPREVKSRVDTVLRRVGGEGSRYKTGPLTIDRDGVGVFWYGQSLDLTPTEFEILWFLAVNHGQVFSRARLLQELSDFDSLERTVDVHIKNIRKKLGAGGALIETVYGMGYRFSPKGLA